MVQCIFSYLYSTFACSIRLRFRRNGTPCKGNKYKAQGIALCNLMYCICAL